MEDGNSGSTQRISKSLYLLLVLGLIGLGCFFLKLDDVFPAASIDLRLSKDKIVQRAKDIMHATGNSDKDLIEATTFTSRDYQEIFLEHEYDVREANELMRSEIPIWLWSTRFCKQQNLEEFWVTMTTDGKLRGWTHQIEAEKELPEVTHEEALKIATTFAKERGDINLPSPDASDAAIKLIEDGTVKQEKRLDHYFTWEDTAKSYKGGHMRTIVYVSGNAVTDFHYTLHVPDSFDSKYKNIRSYNSLLSSIAQVSFAVLTGALLFVFVWALSTNQIRWRLALIAAGLAFVESCLSTANSWPQIMQGYETAKTLQAFVIDKGIAAVVQALLASLSTVVLIGAAEALYRKAFPDKLSIESYLTGAALRTKQLTESVLAGVSVFGIQLGWITLFYLVGKQLGVWSPLQMREVAVLSSVVPAYSGLTMAIEASVFEELLCRILCLILVQKLTRNFWIANFVQAVGWAFMHSDYPQEPAYVRGLELSFVGFAFGMLLRRFGILPSVISHYTYNCLLASLPLLSPNTPGLFATALAAVSPAFVWWGTIMMKVKSHGYIAETGMLNKDLDHHSPISQEVPDARFDYHYTPLATKTRWMIALYGLCGLAFAFVPYRQIGQDAKLSVTREEAVHAAAIYLNNRGVSPDDWRTSVYLGDNLSDEEIQYGYEKEGFKRVDEIMSKARYPLIWYVRFFKPGLREQYEVMISPAGKAIGLDITKPEDAPGTIISEAEAREKIEQFLQNERPEFAPLKFLTASKTKRPNREDHNFNYESPQFKMGDARLKVSVDTVGADVDRPTVTWSIPDAWRYERQKKTIKDQLAQYGSWGMSVAIIAAGIVWLVGLLRSQSIHWRPGLLVALIYVLAKAAEYLNDIPGMICNYDTDIPLASFWTESTMDKLKGLCTSGSLVAFLGVISYAAFRILRPADSVLAFLRKCFKPASEEERNYGKQVWIDALVFGYSASALMVGLDQILDFLRAGFAPSASIASFTTITEASMVFSPTVDFFYQTVALTLVGILCIPVGVGLYAKFGRTWPRFMFGVTLAAMISYASNRYWQSFLLDVLGFAFTALLSFGIVKYIVRGNVLGYAIFFYVVLLSSKVIALYHHAARPYMSDVAMGVLLVLLPLAIGVVRINSRPIKKDQEAV